MPSQTFRDTGTFESADIKYPIQDGFAPNQVLTTDGAGNLSLAPPNGQTGSQLVSVPAGSGPFTMLNIPTTLDRGLVLRIEAIAWLTSGPNAGSMITFVIDCSYNNVGGVVSRVGVSDDYLINKDVNINRVPGSNMDVVTMAGAGIVTPTIYGDATADANFWMTGYLFPPP